ncbi:MAG: DUF1385 domain-containing protein [Negativicutes bacterium]|nr:DUF1385 domain-containing protein [Negativicutes bacterium]MBP8629032.1 DUF1385 domain-containing protein [Negativicutes bacterium]MBP9536627.1 DUF1385 domain-containing protein [Negativicutes bacterium]MBP9948522.1 DUF1385 domain-containing protein [Negativicutes bacterium]
MDKKPNIGGQAVIEGVMMRNANAVATAVREPSGTITVKNEKIISIAERFPILKKPMLRGVVALGESLVVGLKALSYSAQMAGDEGETLSDKEIVLTMIFSLCLTIVLFVIIPTAAAKYVHSAIKDPMLLNLAEGGLRMLIFFLYIYGISRMKDIKRVFQYHGAEHKTIHAYEAGVPLTVENVQKFSTLHPRCGTSFLLIVMIVSILMFAFLGWPDLWMRILSRIILLPVVAGISYEIIRYAGRSENKFVKFATLPGLWLQNLTTNEPDDEQVEVAIRALEEVSVVD